MATPAARYERMVRLHAQGKRASLQHFKRFGLNAEQAQAIRDRVKAGKTKPQRTRTAAARKTQVSTVIIPVAIEENDAIPDLSSILLEGLDALIRERELALADAKRAAEVAAADLVAARAVHTDLASL